MENVDFDIAIIGAGPVGLALACALDKLPGIRPTVALFQADHPVMHNPARDTRVLALNHGSRVFLEQLQGWPGQYAAIETVHVSQKGRLGRTLITHTDFDVAALGYVVPYRAIHASLQQEVNVGHTLRLAGAPATVANEPDSATASVSQNGKTYRARIVVQCDGAKPDTQLRDYNQHAIITSARAALPRPGWAWERFTCEGPLAVLPHPVFADAQSIVWCTSPARARELLTADDASFSRALTDHFGDRLGPFSVLESRHIFPLALSVSKNTVNGRIVTIGNAAQALHPVAGQGLNLGLRDVAGLLRALQPWLIDPAQDPQPALAVFAGARRADRGITRQLTDFMPRIFTTGNPLIEHACGLSLLALDLAKPLRRPLARHLLQGYRN
ncbi:MAG: FAD-dependent monooxygenase [Advenella sp.]|uniref:Monooxygenase n=1 Tax=Advenella kashmirensis TaxID=310575 RepID=A0A356LL35_9BURK|nr:FAD-dependent monooxygenase [Advenella sp. FME57]HBP31676.1 monooxygenase [Advenella kashmirensis]